MPLRDASHQRHPGWGVAADVLPADQLATFAPRAWWQAMTPLADALAKPLAPLAEAVVVYVNEGRWVVDCPDCGGAQLAARADRRFMCNECANVVIGGLWRAVVWPSAKTEKGIERALEKRLPRHAHWLPMQTVADLLSENLENGAV